MNFSKNLVQDSSRLKGGDSTGEYLDPLIKSIMHDAAVEAFIRNSMPEIPVLEANY